MFTDDRLEHFAAQGAPRLPGPDTPGCERRVVDHEGAELWSASYGAGEPVILLHGGLGHSGNWGHQVGTLLEAGYRVVLVDARGHGRSTRDDRPFSYDRMADDLLAIMDAFALPQAHVVGWSDGACVALIAASSKPERVTSVCFFGCNMDQSGTRELDGADPLIGRCFTRHARDYAELSATPEAFERLVADVSLMQATQPDWSAEQLALVNRAVHVVQAEHDEFIQRSHAEYLAATIPGADFRLLEGVSHFAPLQRPALFDAVVLDWLARCSRDGTMGTPTDEQDVRLGSVQEDNSLP